MSDELADLAQIAADLGPGLEPPGYADLLESIVRTCRELTGAAACSVAILDESAEELEFLAADGAGADAIVGTRMDAHQGIAGWAVASGQSLTVGKVADDPRFAREVAEATGYIPRSIFAIPLESDRGVVGVLEILDADSEARASAGVTDERELSLVIATLAAQAAVALEATLVFQDLGRVLLRAAAEAAKAGEDDEDGRAQAVHDALMGAASRARGPQREMATLAAIIYELGRLGPGEREAATKLLMDFLAYATGEREGGERTS